jgi:hypothetical protein
MKVVCLITACILLPIINMFAQALNDEPCNATTIPVNLDVLGQSCTLSTYSWTGATLTAATPNPSCVVSGASNVRDVWFKVTIPASGKLQITIKASQAYFLVAYKGVCTSTINLIELSCSSYPGGDIMQNMQLTSLAPGTVIYLRVTRPTSIAIPIGSISLCALEVLEILAIDNIKKVGIGTTSPLAKLDVVGTVIIRDSLLVANSIETRSDLKAKTLQVTSGAVNGSILQADANGKASWVSPMDLGSVHSIGETYGGGIVFYVTPNRLHGLIAETQDQGYLGWDNAQNAITFPGNHSIAGQNYTDWRLPSFYELYVLHGQRNLFPNLYKGSDRLYWSSTEDGFDKALSTSFDDNPYTRHSLKSSGNLTISIRKF